MSIGYGGKRGAKHGPREEYMNFGGWFPHPREDADVFYRLPQWRQRETLATQAAFRKDPTLQAYTIINPATGQPYPGQNVYEPPADLYKSYSRPPRPIIQDLPDGIPLRVVKKFGAAKLKEELAEMDDQERKELGYLF